ncbi:phage antirepressor KilAC domain-containing protein [Zhongshania sp. BJYM1]|uniref:phage antirepressor KilAC domain-containing protein n=1 Tax=Zhongshania aquatica TaxID=2965069 RepID=UPI0022B59119|nr:phage antirepressor KilAC domain-containing protein [Marortus sp. BJYM1]
MSNIIRFPVIAGVEITTDNEGRFNLNALHHASGLADHKRPSKWLATEQAQDLVLVLQTLSPSEGLAQNPINTIKGGIAPGTFAHELLAVSYAGWISSVFQLRVNQVFINYHTGKLQQPKVPTRLDLIDMMRETEVMRIAAQAAQERLSAELETNRPKVNFYDRVVLADDAISVGKAAKVLNTGSKRLFSFLRQNRWINDKNEPYQLMIERGYLYVKLRSWNHPNQGLQHSVTTLITGKGLAKLQELYENNGAVA